MENSTIILLLAGVLAGLVNFFANYINLPFSKPATLLEDEPPKLKDIWWVAVIGYVVVGCAGAFLTPVLNAIIGTGLKGLELVSDGPGKTTMHPKEANYGFILFGYGIIFGYSATRLLISLFDTLTKKVSSLELKLKAIQGTQKAGKIADFVSNNVNDIINECESQFETNKSDCSGFVKAIAAAFAVTVTGQADDIVNQIQGDGWTKLNDGTEAKAKADNGWLVVAGLKGADNVPAQNNGHVVIVVSGPIAQQKYPTGYWGRLGGIGEKNKTLNWAWNAASRDKVIYAARQI